VQEPLLRTLEAQRARIRERWESLLRGEQVNSPLGRPEVLVHLIDRTLDEVFGALAEPATPATSTPVSATLLREQCRCGQNPLLTYFVSGEQALLEAMIGVQSGNAGAPRGTHAHDLAELYTVVRQIAHQEVDSFCSLCQRAARSAERPRHARTERPGHRFAAPCSRSR
jgi:hypothetical protein